MRQRGDALLKAQRSGMMRKKRTLDIQPPEAIDKSWERDGAPRKAPTGRGLRAVWIEWLLSFIPPSHWSKNFDTDPAHLIDGVFGHDFAHPVLIGWTQATVAFARIDRESAAWLRPLWKYWLDYERHARNALPEPNVAQYMVGLLAAMSSPEDALLQLLRQSDKQLHSCLSACIAVIPRPWSENLGREYLTTTRRVLERGSNDSYPWASTLSAAARALPPSLFAAALREWQLPSDDSKIWYAQATIGAVDHFKETIRTRQRFAEQVNKFIANQAHSTAHGESTGMPE
jgi:hypothetical protein